MCPARLGTEVSFFLVGKFGLSVAVPLPARSNKFRTKTLMGRNLEGLEASRRLITGGTLSSSCIQTTIRRSELGRECEMLFLLCEK